MVRIYESPRSRKGRQDAASGALTREWFVLDTSDPLDVRDQLLLNNPIYYLGLARKSVQWDSLGAPDLWTGTVEYGVSAIPEGLKSDELSFKVSAGTVHVTQSKETKFRVTAADPNPPVANGGVGSAPDMKNAIGVTVDSVAGCDVFVPKCEFTYSRQRAFVDFAYLRTVRNLVGKTNNAVFYGFQPGTLLYLGCEPSSAISTLDDGSKFAFWNLAHSFAHEESKLNVTIGPITIPQKKGWEYVWAKYVPTLDAGASVLQVGQIPSAIYVERVYDEGNFELLEIGK